VREETPDQPDLDSLDVDLEALTHAYFRHVPADERGLHDEEELGAAVRHHLALAAARPQGTAVNVAGQALVPTIVAKRQGILDQDAYDAERTGEAWREDVPQAA